MLLQMYVFLPALFLGTLLRQTRAGCFALLLGESVCVNTGVYASLASSLSMMMNQSIHLSLDPLPPRHHCWLSLYGYEAYCPHTDPRDIFPPHTLFPFLSWSLPLSFSSPLTRTRAHRKRRGCIRRPRPCGIQSRDCILEARKCRESRELVR